MINDPHHLSATRRLGPDRCRHRRFAVWLGVLLIATMGLRAGPAKALSSEQFHFVGFKTVAGSLSQPGQDETVVLLRWDTLEGQLDPAIARFELHRDGQLIADLPTTGYMSETEVSALYAGPQNERLRFQALSWLNQETPDQPVQAAGFAAALRERVLANDLRARLASRIDPNIAIAGYRGVRDTSPGFGDVVYTLTGLMADGAVVSLGTLNIIVDGIADPIAAGEAFEQVAMGRCDAPESYKDHGTVALNWQHPGASIVERYAWGLRLAGYDLYRTIDNIGVYPPQMDLRTIAATVMHDAEGRIEIPRLEKANDQPIVVAGKAGQQTQYAGFNAAFAQFFETGDALHQAGVQPGDRRGYYLVARDQSGNWGDTVARAITVPDLETPPAPWQVRALPSRTTGDVRLMWPQMTVKSYYPLHRAGRTDCNLDTSIVDQRLDFVLDGQQCGIDREQTLDLAVAAYRVYRFANSRVAMDFVDRDGDGYHDADERDTVEDPGTACDAALPDPEVSPLPNYLVASVDHSEIVVREGGQRVLEFADTLPASNIGRNYWYRVAAVDSEDNVGPLSRPVRGILVDREGPPRAGIAGLLRFGKPRCRFNTEIVTEFVPNRFAIDSSLSGIARSVRLRCDQAPLTGPGIWGPESLRVPAPLFLLIDVFDGERRAEISPGQCLSIASPPVGCTSGQLSVDYLDRYAKTLATYGYPSGASGCPLRASRLVEDCDKPKYVDVIDGEIIPEEEGPFLDPGNLSTCLRVYRDLGENKPLYKTLCPGDEPMSFDFPHAGGDRICIAVAAHWDRG
ncbi:MAG: hypothetical protein GY703_24465 [Gammaproteobacteria bacterium]|nr:hypothetical protein [Gammaproteobacteria bacterium]